MLKVILFYILTLVPLNWLICNYAFNRKELSWVVVPILSLVFAVGVERAAAYDIGYNSACDEIDVLETHAGYPRAHVSRFASLYSTGRTRYTISYPNDRTALALPLNNGLSLRGEDVSSSVWSSSPTAGLEGYLVQPRSQSLFRAEQMLTLDGAITFESDDKGKRIVNGTSIELRDAVIVDTGKEKDRKEVYLGTIGPGATVEVNEIPRPGPTTVDAEAITLGRDQFLAAFREDFEERPENVGEIRLVAWAQKAVGGQKIEPIVDRHRGFTAIVVHLRQGPPPSPDRAYSTICCLLGKRRTGPSRRRDPTRRDAHAGQSPQHRLTRLARDDGWRWRDDGRRYNEGKRWGNQGAGAGEDQTRTVEAIGSGARGDMIEVINFTKRYGEFVAVDDLNLSIGKGEVFGFIGPNGAGKSTTIRFLATLLRPTSGEGRVAGHSVVSDPMAVRRVIGVHA